MDYEAAQYFKPYLAPHENVRWVGRPQQGILFRRSDLLIIPFSILWCAFAIFWESAVLAADAPIIMKVWGVPFVLVGLYMVFGRFAYDAFVRSRTFYALTQHSALMLEGKAITTVDLKTLQELHLRHRDGGRGTIVFGPDANQLADLGRRERAPASPEFFGIEDAAGVYTQIQQQRRAS